MKNLVTVGTGDNHMADAMPDQPISHIGKPGQERVLLPKVMGGFVTAIQDHAKMRNALFELLIDRPGGLGSGAGQGAAWEKDGVAVCRQAVPGKEPGTAALLVFEDGAVTPHWEFFVGHDLTAHLQKKIPWRNLGWTDGCA
jgi:hypothetical protein